MNLHTLPTGSVISWTQHQGYVYTAVKARGGSWYSAGRYLTTTELEHQITTTGDSGSVYLMQRAQALQSHLKRAQALQA